MINGVEKTKVHKVHINIMKVNRIIIYVHIVYKTVLDDKVPKPFVDGNCDEDYAVDYTISI